MARVPSRRPKAQGSGLPSFRESRPTMSFRDNLQHLRATHAMTQEQLALMLGVSRQSVTKWEAEKSYPEMDKLLKLCQIFDVTLDDLVQGDLTTSAPTPAVQARAAILREAAGGPPHGLGRLGRGLGAFPGGRWAHTAVRRHRHRPCLHSHRRLPAHGVPAQPSLHPGLLHGGGPSARPATLRVAACCGHRAHSRALWLLL